MMRPFLVVSLWLFFSTALFAQYSHKAIVDSIIIEKNWRTKDKIILRELEFGVGDQPTNETIEQSIQKIWNIGNFAEVSYRQDTLNDGRRLFKITARDALTIVPILSYSGNKNDYNLSLGVSDNNFLGRNIGLNLVGSTGTNGVSYNFGIKLPRQLLYKNMTLSVNSSMGHNTYTRYANREAVSHVAIRQKSFGLHVGNPNHTDFSYTFSPDLDVSLFNHQTDTSLVDASLPFSQEYNVTYLSIGMSESVGIINQKRHQKDGYSFHLSTGFNIGLNGESPYYQTISGGGQYHKLFNRVVQLSSSFSTGYTTANTTSLKHHLGSGQVKGILFGEISGKSYYSAALGGYFTYLNSKWLAVVHSIYFNAGNGTEKYPDLFTTHPLMAVGTGAELRVPMVPWLSIRFHFTYSGKNSNWFNMEF
ncbi:MAG: hypothetical protein JEZ14_16900 [Marinilabiliaceae bacterium]|nr:hypothetical protein [Marinilabiliaceae bacterium]